MPKEKAPIERQVRDAHRPGDQIGKEHQLGIGLEEFAAERVIRGMEDVNNAGNVYFRVLGPGMVAMHQQGRKRQSNKQKNNATRSQWLDPITPMPAKVV